LTEGCKGPFEIAFCASLQDIELQPKAAGGRLQVSGLRLGIGIAFIDEDRREGRRGDEFVQQLLSRPKLRVGNAAAQTRHSLWR